MGFALAYRMAGGAPTIYDLPVKANAVISLGELVNLESGYVDGAATNDAALVGIALEAANNTGGADGALSIKAIVDPDAVYAVDDANARLAGATLDIAAGGMGVAASVNADLLVVAPSSAAERTLVRIARASHYLTA